MFVSRSLNSESSRLLPIYIRVSIRVGGFSIKHFLLVINKNLSSYYCLVLGIAEVEGN